MSLGMPLASGFTIRPETKPFCFIDRSMSLHTTDTKRTPASIFVGVSTPVSPHIVAICLCFDAILHKLTPKQNSHSIQSFFQSIYNFKVGHTFQKLCWFELFLGDAVMLVAWV
jgi:hypothetical protein